MLFGPVSYHSAVVKGVAEVIADQISAIILLPAVWCGNKCDVDVTRLVGFGIDIFEKISLSLR
jgi:hypothetical protein